MMMNDDEDDEIRGFGISRHGRYHRTAYLRRYDKD